MPELAEKYGKQLAAAVEEVLAKPLTPITGRLATSYREIPLAFAQLPTRDDLVAQTKDTNKYIAMRAKMLLEEIDAGKPLSPTYPYPVQLWRLGNEIDWYLPRRRSRRRFRHPHQSRAARKQNLGRRL